MRALRYFAMFAIVTLLGAALIYPMAARALSGSGGGGGGGGTPAPTPSPFPITINTAGTYLSNVATPSVSIPTPTAMGASDALVVWNHCQSATPTTPTGFTVEKQITVSGNQTDSLYYAAPASGITFPLTVSGNGSNCYSWRLYDIQKSGGPVIDAVADTTSAVATGPLAGAIVTTTQANELVMEFCAAAGSPAGAIIIAIGSPLTNTPQWAAPAENSALGEGAVILWNQLTAGVSPSSAYSIASGSGYICETISLK